MSEFWVRTNPRARKQHTCTLCRRAIQPGEVYMRGASFDGGANTWKECAHCEQFFTFLNALWGEGEYSEDSATEWYPENIGELRVKVQWTKRWTRADGTIYPIPEIIREQRQTKAGYGYTSTTGIKAGTETKETA